MWIWKNWIKPSKHGTFMEQLASLVASTAFSGISAGVISWIFVEGLKGRKENQKIVNTRNPRLPRSHQG